MNDTKIKKMVTAAMLAALTFAATKVIQIPMPMNGYINLGDGVVLICGWVLGPVYGFLAAGIGSALTDALSGYAHYVIPTFVIKGLMAVIAWGLFKLLSSKTEKNYLSPAGIISACAAEVWMVLGYYLCKAIYFGNGLAAAISSIPGNIMQGIAGVVIGILLIKIIRSIIKE